MTPWLVLLIHAALVAGAALPLAAVLGPNKAYVAKLRVPPLAQPARDLLRQWRKPPLRPANTSFLVGIAPSLACAAAGTAALLTPGFCLGMATAGAADLVVVTGLLALSRLAPVLAAYDAGLVLPGAAVAAARLPSEPVILLAALVLILLTGSTNLDAAIARDSLPHLAPVLAGFALLAAIGRDSPVPALYSGRDAALIALAAHLRRIAAFSLVILITLPLGIAQPGAGLAAWLIGAGVWLGKLIIAGSISATLGPVRAALPAATLLALTAAVIAAVGGRT